MNERCAICGHEKAMNRCWRLSCPENGGNSRTLELARKDEPERKLL